MYSYSLLRVAENFAQHIYKSTGSLISKLHKASLAGMSNKNPNKHSVMAAALIIQCSSMCKLLQIYMNHIIDVCRGLKYAFHVLFGDENCSYAWVQLPPVKKVLTSERAYN